MRRVTLNKEITTTGTYMIPVRAPRPFTPGDTIELISPDWTLKVVYEEEPSVIQCEGCVFNNTRRCLCPRFQHGALLCMQMSEGISSGYIFKRLSDVMEDL
jgi:hypothetical protein